MHWNRVSEEEFQQISMEMEQAEKSGFFEGMFTGECKQVAELPSREKLMQSIKPGMKLYRSFFLSIYADEITWPGSSEVALKALEDAGCSNARRYYKETVTAYEKKRDEELRPVEGFVKKQWDADWQRTLKEVGAQRKRQEWNRAENWNRFGKMLNFQ